MTKPWILWGSAGLIWVLLFPACHSDQKGFETSSFGVQFNFHTHHADSVKPYIGDLVTADVSFRTKDTLFFISSRDLNIPYSFEILEPRFIGDLYEAFMLMGVGDSATFRFKGDSLFLLDFEIDTFPDFIDSNTIVFMDAKLLHVLPREQFNQEKQAYQELMEKSESEMKQKEEQDIADYLTTHNIRQKPKPSGLYVISQVEGNGPEIEPGKIVRVNYTMMFINSEIFETTIQEIAVKNNIFDSSLIYKPFEYVHGDGTTIPGFEEGLSYMRQGGKAKLIIPSSLAFGEHGYENLIPPYTPIVYEIEILEVK